MELSKKEGKILIDLLVMRGYKQLTLEDYEHINKITKNIKMGDVNGIINLGNYIQLYTK